MAFNMSKKAKSLPDIVNVFHPKALTAEQTEYYQPTAAVRSGENYEYYDDLYGRINMSANNMHILVVGHGGCGKSTELHMLARQLRDNGSPAIIIEALDDLNLNDFTYIDIFVLIVKRLAEYAENNNYNIDKKIISAFKTAMSTKTTQEFWEAGTAASLETGASASVNLLFIIQLMAKITASLKMGSGIKEELRSEMKPKMADITEAVNAFIDNLNGLIEKKGFRGKVVIIIDGLEKCTQDCVKKLFIDDVSSIKQINTHMVISCPISLYRSSDAALLTNNFDTVEVMPMIKTHNADADRSPNHKGINVIKELILKRVEDTCFEESALEQLITMSGGNLRDTCYLVKNCAHVAYMRKHVAIDMACVDYTLNKYAADLFLRIDTDYYPVIKEIVAGNYMHKNNKALIELLYAGAVFEYNGERWVDLHPLIRRYIDNNPGILD